MKRTILVLAILAGCASSTDAPSPSLTTAEQATTVCGAGPTVFGIDVSYYQGTIDWNRVKAAGVEFAFVRVSDGLHTIDSKFEANWGGSRDAGILHGAYQFFRPDQDPIAQADLLLSKIGGTLAPDDLPPVIDVEAADGLSPSAVAAAVHAWADHVTTALGRAPIIYTGYYFWRDSVGAPDVGDSVLWHAQYTSAACPNIPAPWQDWAFWQYSSSGTVDGISGRVDVDRWNGDRASLDAFLGAPGSCGDGTCSAGEDSIACPEDCGPCGTIDTNGGTVDDGDACFVPGGPLDYMRQVKDAGNDGDLLWTHATEDTVEGNSGQWNLYLAESGHYRIEVYTAAAYAQSHAAHYVIHTAAGDETMVLDQTAIDGWQTLGTYDLAAGGHQWVHLGDNTGEPLADGVQIVFDAVRLTRIDDAGGAGTNTDPGTGADVHAGCAAGGTGAGTGAFVGLALAIASLRRRRR